MILLENPMLVDHLFYKKATGELLAQLGTLPPALITFLKDHYLYKYVLLLCSLIARLSNERWAFFYRQLQDFISVLVMSLPPQSNQIHLNPGIQQATAIIGWIYEENNRRLEEVEKSKNKPDKPNKLVFKKSDFYNEVICENFLVRYDFVNWKRQSGYASISIGN